MASFSYSQNKGSCKFPSNQPQRSFSLESLTAESQRQQKDRRLKQIKTNSLARPDQLRYGAFAEGEMHEVDRIMDDILENNHILNEVMAISNDILQISATEYFRRAVEPKAKSGAIDPTLQYRVPMPRPIGGPQTMLETEYSTAIRRFTPKVYLQEREKWESANPANHTVIALMPPPPLTGAPVPGSTSPVDAAAKATIDPVVQNLGRLPRLPESFYQNASPPGSLDLNYSPTNAAASAPAKYVPEHRTARKFFSSKPETKPKVVKCFESEMQAFGGGPRRPSLVGILPDKTVNYATLLDEQSAMQRETEKGKQVYDKMLQHHFRIQDLKLQNLQAHIPSPTSH